MPALQTITDSLLVAAIDAATERVVFIAPGVWPPVATAITNAWQRLGASRVTVILDVDPEVCRIGYGSEEGLDTVQKAAAQLGESVGQEPGVRICVVIADQQTFVFSPNPRLVEAPPGELAEVGATQPRANGIVLSNPPVNLERELGGGPEGDAERTLGMNPLDQQKLASLKKDLAANPAKKFDLARAVSVYNAKIQFVEFTVSGCRLSENKARLPKDLIKVLKRNPALSQKIENSIHLLDAEDVLITDPKLSQETIFKHRAAISEKFLRPIGGIGTIIERSRNKEFMQEVETLKAEVTSFAANVKERLATRFQKTAEDLAGEVLTEVLADIPEKWRSRIGPNPNRERVRWMIVDELLKAFGTPERKVGKMSVETVFKDVTYDMLKDPEFRSEVADHFPDLPLMEEYNAAKESPSSQQGKLFD
jgi:hypothetical protein